MDLGNIKTYYTLKKTYPKKKPNNIFFNYFFIFIRHTKAQWDKVNLYNLLSEVMYLSSNISIKNIFLFKT